MEKGLHDFSISRVKKKMPWGVEVPGDPEQIMYVWFDAFVNYISTIGWPEDMGTFKKWWPVVQMAGKDQVRMQVVMWAGNAFLGRLGAIKANYHSRLYHERRTENEQIGGERHRSSRDRR